MARDAPLLNVITLDAEDIDSLKEFYVALGWPLTVDEELKVFELRGGVLALYPVERLARDGHAAPERGRNGIRFALEVLVGEPSEVDELAQCVERAGGRVTKPPVDADFFEGRSCYFCDPEQNYFEVAWAPPDNLIFAAARRAASQTG